MKNIKNFLKNRTLLFTIIMMAIPVALTIYAWKITKEHVYQIQQAKFDTLVKENEKALLHRIDSYKQALLGGRGFFEGSNYVDREEWKAYVNATDILYNFPGINGIGAIYDVPGKDIKSFLEKTRKDGAPNFTITPKGKHPENFIIKYIEPLNINIQAVGLNIGFEKNRRLAAIKAKETGKPTITKRILLVQDAEKTPGFLLLLPVYKKNMPANTKKERIAAFSHWVYAPFIGKNFMKDLTDSQGKTFRLQVYDGNKADQNTLIFDSNTKDDSFFSPKFRVSKPLNVMQQDWLLVWSSTEGFENIEKSNEPLLILIAGFMFTGLFSMFVVLLNINFSNDKSYGVHNYIVPSSAFVITLLFAFFLHNSIEKKEKTFISNTTSEASKSISGFITQNIEGRILALQRMADRWNQRGRTPFKEWQKDAYLYVKDQPGLKVVEWIDNTYHVKWVEPLAGNKKAIGLNILFNQERKDALKNAENKNQVTITPPIDLVQGYKAFISYSPLKFNNKFDGFIAGIFNIDDLVDAALVGASLDNFVVQLSYDNKTFYNSSNEKIKKINPEWVAKQTIIIADKQWILKVFPKKSYIKKHSTFLPDLTLAIGLILAILVALIIYSYQQLKSKTALLQEKENLLSTFVKYAPAAVAMFDKELNYIAASNRWYKDYSLKSKNIIGKSHYDVFPEIEKNHPEWKRSHERALRGEVVKKPEEEFIRKNGQAEWIRYELHPWTTGANQIGGIIMFTENITERKQMDIMKNEFISTVNHELRTPLTSIQMSLGLLKQTASSSLNKDATKILNLAYNNCERLIGLVNDILDMEKIAAGKMEYRIEPTEMCQLTKDVIEQNHGYAARYKTKFKLDSKIDKVYCDVDPARFNQALSNLLSNAAKFSPEGESIFVTIKKEDSKNLRISVKDNGPGISDSFKSKIFNKFAQADSSSTRAKGGSGLGLNITKSIIEAFGGSINFTSKENKGTTFFFILPINKKGA